MNKRIKKKHWKKAFAWVSVRFFGSGLRLSQEESTILAELIKKERYREATLFIQVRYLDSIQLTVKLLCEKIESTAKDNDFEY
ncbi:MAG: hypothetical protein IJ889_00160 [Eubacterium sp.]|nr:hypothetical protein [Eubacterium sp.]MBR2247312.1 hypothetical protein [Bacilli bacterium]